MEKVVLEMMLVDWFDVQGIGVTYKDDNYRVIRCCFLSELDMTADDPALRHVLEHIQSPVDFVKLRGANCGSGEFCTEAPVWSRYVSKSPIRYFLRPCTFFLTSDSTRMFDAV